LPCTGPALFHWTRDKELLENGPLEFRLKTAHHVNVKQLVEGYWENQWKKESPPFTILLQKTWRKKSVEQFVRYATLCFLFVGLPFRILTYAGASTTTNLTFLGSVGLLILLGYIFTTIYEERKKSKTLIYLFVYGTLKSGFHWNQKFLGRSKFISKAKTVHAYPLVVGESGVPYLLGDISNNNSKCINGEIWQVDVETLLGLDQYEGVPKNYYVRNLIEVVPEKSRDGKPTKAFAYFKAKSSPQLIDLPKLSEYTLEFHKANYKAIKHILVKQEMYLGISHTNT